MTGVDYDRGYLGKWVAAEGQVFSFNENDHTHVLTERDIPPTALKFCSIDYGDVHAFVCLWWWVDEKGVMRTFKEIYKTQSLITDMAAMIHAYNKEYNHEIEFYVADHGGLNRQMRDLGIYTRKADKKDMKIPGINMMKRRFIEKTISYRREGHLLHDPDKELFDNGKPYQTIDEFGGYAYKPEDKQRGDNHDDEPMKGEDDGIDSSRYGVVALEHYFAYKPVVGTSESPNALPDYLNVT